jgi:hypothetical protein
MSSADESLPWLTISDAARQTGRNLDAMRALVRRGRLPRRKGNRGEWLVQLPEAAARADSDTDSDTALDSALDNGLDSGLAVLREQVVTLHLSLVRTEGRLDAVQGRLIDRDRELAEVKAERERLLTMLSEAQAALIKRRSGIFSTLWTRLLGKAKGDFS